MLRKTIEYFKARQRELFLVDGIGAIVSAISLGIILVEYEYIFGIPIPSLYLLAAIPCVFIVYDALCYFTLKSDYGIFLKIIAALNIAYCLFSAGIAIYHRYQLFSLGWLYISVEIAIIYKLARIQWQVGKK